MTNPHELEDIWITAIMQIPNAMPLVELLRSDTPMPSGARKLIAEMLSPGNPPTDSYMLEPKLNPEFDKMLRKLEGVAKAKLSIVAGEKWGNSLEGAGTVGVRQLARWMKENLPEKLGARLRGEDGDKKR